MLDRILQFTRRPPRWARDALFAAVCLAGAITLATSILSGNHVDQPDSFDRSRRQRADFAVTVDQVDLEFERHWREAGLEEEIAPPADDLTIARRLSLSLTGTVPSLEEIRALEQVKPEDRVDWWVSRLLEDRRYADYVAERLARAFVGTENGPFIIFRRRRFVLWLSDRLAENTPYNEIVQRLIADDGLWTDSPAVNFLTVTANPELGNKPDPVRLAARTTRAFLGMRIDCLQCHDNNLPQPYLLGDGKQEHDGLQRDFHQLAAFFSEAQQGGVGIFDEQGANYDFQFLYEDETETVPARPPYLTDLPLKGDSRRERLAYWVTHERNKPFARAIVNRTWALLCGKALIEQVDNIPLNGYTPDDVEMVGEEARWWNGEQPFPPGMETLADDFIAHGYDLRRLIRLIAATRAFQLDSRVDESNVEKSGGRVFTITAEHELKRSVFPLSRLRPEQVAGSLIQASTLTTIDANATFLARLIRYSQENDFVQRYGDTGEDEFDDRSGTIPQRLLMMNGELVRERTAENPLQNAAARIAMLAPSDELAVESAYLACCTRRPSPLEREHFSARLKGTSGDQRSQAMEDIYCVLLNSTEFSWNH